MGKYNIELIEFKHTEIFENVRYQASLLINGSTIKVSMEHNIIYERKILNITSEYIKEQLIKYAIREYETKYFQRKIKLEKLNYEKNRNRLRYNIE